MSFEIQPTGPATPGQDARQADRAGAAASTSFSRIYELQEARARRSENIPPMIGDRIPDEVWDEVDRASALFDKLDSQGRRMMFDSDRVSGRVVATLLEPNGSVEPIPLTDAVDFGSRA